MLVDPHVSEAPAVFSRQPQALDAGKDVEDAAVSDHGVELRCRAPASAWIVRFDHVLR
ncbi:hypothetical protein SBD_6899 [Streptomyces bottropensis ATCC 25435]|uniref:Uncharacterized protein n=1 Tax=Streptomyces bottropensis ATCC 25435 TaxID=1054862 RepID=M3ETC9_9ACTN|nr:hypothetical protein SBD_6899 [Streptomyces bottropensis ATCC 25435]